MSTNLALSSARPALSPRGEAMVFLKRHLPVKDWIEAIRDRFDTIDTTLLEDNINVHDLGHQIRVAINTVLVLRELNFDHRSIMQAGNGALLHDVRHLPETESSLHANDDYLGGNKGKYRRHALLGAMEVEQVLTALLEHAQAGQPLGELETLITYKDQQGEVRQIDQQDINGIVEAVLNHNDYGQSMEGYDPKTVNKAALAVQFSDKIDNRRKRVYQEHMIPGAFIEGHPQYDPKYYHRCVSYCINDYDFSIDHSSKTITVRYEVDLTRFRRLMQQECPGFQYTKGQFLADFDRAYSKSSRIAAEAVGVLLENMSDEPTLNAEFHFTGEDASDQTYAINYSRPDREIYKQGAPKDEAA